MKGKKVERRFGWDCHGLPVENLIEKELGLNSKTDIENYGVANFNEACRDSVLRYVNEWKQTITRLGRWVDFDNDYKTMNPDYMESIWWVMKSLWEKGLLYEGHYILPYCPRCSTVLSNHELATGGYKDVHDPAITIRFKVVKAGPSINDDEITNGKTYFLAWTTTPWTLPSNVALCMNAKEDYSKIIDRIYEPDFPRPFEIEISNVLLKNRFPVLQKNYNWFADYEKAVVREQALNVFKKTHDLFKRIEASKTEVEDYPQQDFVIFIQYNYNQAEGFRNSSLFTHH